MLDLHRWESRELHVTHIPIANDSWLRADQRILATCYELFDLRRMTT